MKAKKDLLIKFIDYGKLLKNDKPYGIAVDVSDDFSEPIIELIWFNTKDKREKVFLEIQNERNIA